MIRLRNESTFREAIIRLAHENPAGIREHLLPLLKKLDGIVSGAQVVKEAGEIDPIIQRTLSALDLLTHHRLRPKVRDLDLDRKTATIEVNASQSMCAAYIENHLSEQLGSRARFEVHAGRSKVYIDLKG